MSAREQGRVLGIDYGSVRIGLAVTDPLRILASGAGTVENDGMAEQRIAGLVAAQNIRLIVVGMPYAPDGGKGEKAKEIDRFVERLRELVQVPIETWDESFTSVTAQKVLRDAGARKKQRRERHRIDEMAARLLLQEYLDGGES
jgi:putative Holliday junction resolvase